MPRKKLVVTTSQENIDKLKKALKAGAPLNIALQFANIPATTYYYWVAMHSIVTEAKGQDELEDLNADKFGVSIENIKNMAASSSSNKKSQMGAFIEPSAESMMTYRNNVAFRRFADQCYEIIQQCNEARAEVALGHLTYIAKSVNDKRINASGSMWFLERTLSDYFSKPSEKSKDETEDKVPIQSVKVEFVDPGTDESKKRMEAMESLILSEQKGISGA